MWACELGKAEWERKVNETCGFFTKRRGTFFYGRFALVLVPCAVSDVEESFFWGFLRQDGSGRLAVDSARFRCASPVYSF